MLKRPKMKRPFLTISVVLLTVGLVVFIFNSVRPETAIYHIDLPAGLDTLDFKASINLDQTKKIHKIQFPTGGTGTTILINDSSYLTKVHSQIKSKPLVSGDFKNNEGAILDISSLTPGKYYVHYMACNLGGIFPLTIK